jgi:acid phosphatase
VLLVLGDNFGDFVDGYKGSLEERKALMEKHKDMWGTKWIVLPNPSYGSWESAPFGHDYKEPDQRGKKQGAMAAWAQ